MQMANAPNPGATIFIVRALFAEVSLVIERLIFERPRRYLHGQPLANERTMLTPRPGRLLLLGTSAVAMLRGVRPVAVIAVVTLSATLALACGGPSTKDDDAYEHVMPFDSAQVRLVGRSDTIPLRVQLAVSAEQRSMGLMERRRLADDAGMLFVYDSTQPPDAGFWMFRTLIPLDIAFVDSAGVIRSIRAMVPCTATIAEGCKSYTPDVPYRYALEVNAGFLARHGVVAGNRLLLPDLPAAAASSSSARILPPS